MQLNLNIIQNHLPQEYQAKRYGPEDRTCTFQRPLLYEINSGFRDGILYVAQAETLPRTPPPQQIGMICIGDRIPQAWLASGVPLLVIQNSPGVLTVFNQIHSMYNHLDAWDNLLRDELERDSDFDIKQILRLGSLLLGRSIIVSDHTLRGIFHTECYPAPDGGTEVHVFDSPGSMSVEYSEKIKDVCRLERVIKVPYLTSLDADGEKNYCNNLYPIGSFAGCISIREGGKPFRESDYLLMDHFFACFQKAFLKHLRSYGQVESASLTALRNLLSHTQLGLEEQAQPSLQPGEAWVCFNLREYQSERSLLKEYMYATLNGILPRTVYAFIYHGEIVGIFRLQGKDISQEDSALLFFGDTLRRMGYYGGISNPFTDLTRLANYLRQASYAAEHGHSDDGPLYFFRDLTLSYLLDSCTWELPADSLCSQGMIALLENDRQKGTEYIKTLDTYLRNETHITQTAEALYIHRSSLIKRLDKIQRLLGDDLNDPDVRLYYRICLALINSGRQ